MKIDDMEKVTDMAIHIAEVRKTGLTNMFHLTKVIEILMVMGYDDTAEYLQKNKEEYMKLLKISGKY